MLRATFEAKTKSGARPELRRYFLHQRTDHHNRSAMAQQAKFPQLHLQHALHCFCSIPRRPPGGGGLLRNTLKQKPSKTMYNNGSRTGTHKYNNETFRGCGPISILWETRVLRSTGVCLPRNTPNMHPRLRRVLNRSRWAVSEEHARWGTHILTGFGASCREFAEGTSSM